MLSILIPIYNTPVRELVTRIAEMAEKAEAAYEIIAADDASTNQRLLEQNEFLNALKHCSYFKFATNKGRTATTQFLAEKAQFQHLLFLDADVLPKNPDFLEIMLQHIGKASVIFGGIAYPERLQNADHALRYWYGKNREVQPVSVRKTKPYLSLVIQHLLVDKSLFLSCNPAEEHGYGLDVYLSYNLQQQQVSVLHLDNPTVHLGLESNAQYLLKTLAGLQNMASLEQSGKVAADYRPLQRVASKLQRLNLDGVYINAFKAFLPKAERNLSSPNPSLHIFDAWRLYHFLTYTRHEA